MGAPFARGHLILFDLTSNLCRSIFAVLCCPVKCRSWCPECVETLPPACKASAARTLWNSGEWSIWSGHWCNLCKYASGDLWCWVWGHLWRHHVTSHARPRIICINCKGHVVPLILRLGVHISGTIFIFIINEAYSSNLSKYINFLVIF